MPRKDDGTPALRDLEARIASLEAALREKDAVETRLRESEERFRSMVETTVVGVLAVDREHRTTFVNARMAKMLGYTPAEMLGQAVESFMFDEDLPAHRERMARRRRGEDETYELRFRQKNSGTVWTIASATAVQREEGTFDGSFATFTDITERKQMEDRLRAMAQLLDMVPNSIMIHDREGRFLYANQRTFEIHGYSESEFMAKNLRDIDVPESAALIDERMRLIAEKGEASFEVAHVRRDGMTLPMDVFVRETVWNGTPTLLSVSTDISERKQTEAALSQQVDELRRWYAVTLGREERIAELKREVDGLAARLGLPPPYADPGDRAPRDKT
jgi:PAS domain S-box-containing protein